MPHRQAISRDRYGLDPLPERLCGLLPLIVNDMCEESAVLRYNVKMKPPKSPKTRALIERLNIYLRDNPTCRLEDAARLLGIKSCTVRKWKQFEWIEHQTAAAARRAAAEAAIAAAANKPAPAPAKQTRKPRTTGKPSSGVVVPSSGLSTSDNSEGSGVDPDSIEGLIARGKELKISELRALIKAHLVSQVSDAKAVSNFAAGLRALSGVQDVELEDIYESEQMVRVYVPAEDAMPAEVLEVDPIEY